MKVYHQNITNVFTGDQMFNLFFSFNLFIFVTSFCLFIVCYYQMFFIIILLLWCYGNKSIFLQWNQVKLNICILINPLTPEVSPTTLKHKISL